jgi:two-component system sensor histidine kinase HydH
MEPSASGPSNAIDRLCHEIVDDLTSGVVVVNGQGWVIFANRSAYGQLGFEPEGQLQNVRLVDAPIPPAFRQVLREILEGGEPVSRREVVIQHLSGKRREIGVSSSKIREEGGGMIFLFTDITPFRNLERSAELNRQLAYIGEMTAGVVHQLRNPLSVIAGTAELLGRRLKPEDEHLNRDANVILEEVERLERLVSQLLNFSKPFELSPRFIRSGAVLERMLRLCRHAAEVADVELEAEQAVDVPEAYADEEMAAQAVSNVVINAIDAAGAGGKVMVRVRRVGDAVAFEVLDNGPGVHLQEGDNPFAPFFSKKKSGTGIGLAIAHRIVTAHGGSITFANRPGGGAIFTVRLPLEPGSQV